MKCIYLLTLTFLISFSCKNELEKKAQAETVNTNKTAAPSPVLRKISKLSALKGSYIGTPEVNGFLRGRYQPLLNFSILAIDTETNTISGHLITEGKKTIFEGKFQFDKKLNLIVAENSESDTHVFLFPQKDLKIEIKKEGTKLFLTQEPLRSELTKSVFKYDPTLRVVYEDRMLNRHPVNASTKKLTYEDLEDNQLDHYFIEKAIYARHGLAFKNSKDIYFFENVVEWYAPYFLNVDDELTELEKTNLIFLRKFENQAPKEPAETSHPQK